MNPTIPMMVGLGAVLLLPVLWRIRRRRFDPLEPLNLFILGFGVMFVVRPAAMLAQDEMVYFGLDVAPTLSLAVFLALVGAVGFIIGYELPVGSSVAGRLPSPPPRIPVSTATVGALAAGALGILALGVVLTVDGIGGLRVFLGGRGEELGGLLDQSSAYIWYASLLVLPAALVAVALAVRSRRPFAILVAAFLTAIALLRTVPVGNRMFLLVFVGGGLVFLHLHRGKRLGFRVLAAGLALGLLLSYALLTFRNAESRAGTASDVAALVREPGQVLSPLLRGADAEMAPALAGALSVIPDQLSYRYGGATLGDLVLRPIPRQLWNGKPDTPSQDVVTALWPGGVEYGFDPAFSPLLVFFWDFGFVGVVMGMIVFGVAARALYEYFLLHRPNVAAQLFFSTALWFMVPGMRNSPADTLVYATFILAPLLVILWVGARREVALAAGYEPGAGPARPRHRLVGGSAIRPGGTGGPARKRWAGWPISREHRPDLSVSAKPVDMIRGTAGTAKTATGAESADFHLVARVDLKTPQPPVV